MLKQILLFTLLFLVGIPRGKSAPLKIEANKKVSDSPISHFSVNAVSENILDQLIWHFRLHHNDKKVSKWYDLYEPASVHESAFSTIRGAAQAIGHLNNSKFSLWKLNKSQHEPISETISGLRKFVSLITICFIKPLLSLFYKIFAKKPFNGLLKKSILLLTDLLKTKPGRKTQNARRKRDVVENDPNLFGFFGNKLKKPKDLKQPEMSLSDQIFNFFWNLEDFINKKIKKRPSTDPSTPKSLAMLLTQLFEPMPHSGFRLKRDVTEKMEHRQVAPSLVEQIKTYLSDSLPDWGKQLIPSNEALQNVSEAEKPKPANVTESKLPEINSHLMSITAAIDIANGITDHSLKLIRTIYRIGELIYKSLSNYAYPKSKMDKPTRLHLSSIANMVQLTVLGEAASEGKKKVTEEKDNTKNTKNFPMSPITRQPRSIMESLYPNRPLRLKPLLGSLLKPSKQSLNWNDEIVMFFNNLFSPKVWIKVFSMNYIRRPNA